jgi:hypothetical protein
VLQAFPPLKFSARKIYVKKTKVKKSVSEDKSKGAGKAPLSSRRMGEPLPATLELF